MTTRIRHNAPPVPSGCRYCGEEQGHHGRSWVRSVGMHGWEQPTREQVIARMKARRAARRGQV